MSYTNDSPVLNSIACHNPIPLSSLPRSSTAIADTGASGLYLTADAPTSSLDSSAPAIIVGTATGHIQHSTASCLSLPSHLPDCLRQGHIFPAFKNSLVGIGKFCDNDCKVLFSKHFVTVFNHSGKAILTGWRETHGAKLWVLSVTLEASAYRMSSRSRSVV